MRRVIILAGVALVTCVFLAWQDGTAWDLMAGLGLGWLGYLARVIPRVRVAWDGVATGILCLALFAVGLHRTLTWFHGEAQKASGTAGEGRRPWSVRWTAALVTLIVLMFVTGIAATGIVHQVGWLIASRRSLVERKAIPIRHGWGSSVDHLRRIGFGASMLDVTLEPSPSGESLAKRKTLQSWMTEILPGTNYVMGDGFRPDLPWNDPRNSAYFKCVVPVYLNPEVYVIRSAEGYALSHYAGNVHVLGEGRTPGPIGPGSGASNTILAGEVAEGFKPWGDPANLRDPGLGVNRPGGGFGGPSGSGANFLFLDGSVRFLRDATAPAVLRKLSRPG